MNCCKKNKKQKKTQKMISRSHIIIHYGITDDIHMELGINFSLFLFKKNASNIYKINLMIV